MSANSSEVQVRSSNGFNINPLDIIFYLLRNWYWFVLSVAVFGGWAYYNYSKIPFVYTRSATVMIKDPFSGQGSANLDRFSKYNNSNVSNEILQFKSHKIMCDAVERLNANIDYVIMDGLREKELYTQGPVIVSFENDETRQPTQFKLQVINSDKVKLYDFAGNEKELIAPIGKTVNTPAGDIKISKTLFFTDDWFNKEISIRKNAISETADVFNGNLVIDQAVDDASIIYVSMNDYNTARAEDVLNTLITIFNEETIKDKNQTAINTSNFINERLIIIEKELGGVETEIEQFKRDRNIIDVGSEAASSMSDKIEFTNTTKNLQLQTQLATQIKGYLNDPTHATDLIPTGLSNNSEIEAQIAMYNANKLKRDKLIEGSSDKNPVVQELNKSLEAMRASINRTVDNSIVTLNTQTSAARSRAGQAAARVSNAPTMQKQMLGIERQQRIKEELYLYLLNKREESALSQATTSSDARVLDPAGGGNSPVSPNGRTMIISGVAKGLAFPLVILLACMFFDTRIKNRKDLEDAISVPFLGEVPKDNKKTEKKEKGEKKLIFRVEGRDIVSEAFRIIRTNMDFMKVKSENMKVITFSSFAPGSGKTFVSSNLAASFAMTGKKVIMVDLDIRKGTMTKKSKSSHIETGMTQYLAGNAEIKDIIIKDGMTTNLDLIPAGPVPPNPAELLLSHRLEGLMDYLRERYDYIFVDNVPVGVVADATITNRVADLTIFIIRVGMLDRRMLPEIEKLYQSGQLKNMSLVLNGSIVTRNGYGYGGYGYGYGYGYSYEEEKPWYKKMFSSKKKHKKHHSKAKA